ncbi:class I SAM-dependent methyltransferase [Saccharothrix coeruleofusca]|uniref:Methyltransferase n=1 Tax=Saccharothrix coeruleofusca TaxID=33919 RepID=A0A918EI83_9PSEU|nr:class I SAM-dependent methyltransferase [Saccharothrix coeruleofusca]GGP87630.1 methyltransferase [Saccharothrix coeruleofusca]
MYSDAENAALYDMLNAWGPSDDFYLDLVMAAESVLDVGCGTGVLLHRARENGHRGRLVGLDPDRAALDRARARDDVDWVVGTAASARWDREFELAVMASHAFQVFVTDDDLRASLTAIRAALVDGGRFAFETRNPLPRPWERWTPDNAVELVDPGGRHIRVFHRVESVVGDVVTFSETVATPAGEPLRVDRTSLRFLPPDALDSFLGAAGFAVEARYGDWSRGPLTPTSREIITVARRI